MTVFDAYIQKPLVLLFCLRLHISKEVEANYLRVDLNICGSHGIAGGECGSGGISQHSTYSIGY